MHPKKAARKLIARGVLLLYGIRSSTPIGYSVTRAGREKEDMDFAKSIISKTEPITLQVWNAAQGKL